jgi:hypothetical protein
MKRETLILLVNIGVVLLGGLLILAIQIVPYFTLSLLGISILTLFFMTTEKWMTHDAVEFENRFWTTMAFCLVYSEYYNYSTLCVILFCNYLRRIFVYSVKILP